MFDKICNIREIIDIQVIRSRRHYYFAFSCILNSVAIYTTIASLVIGKNCTLYDPEIVDWLSTYHFVTQTDIRARLS